MTSDSTVSEEAAGNQRLAILLAMAMFVLVVDTSLMNVSISSVVRDLDTTVSGVQSAIALEGQPEELQDEIIRINTDARPLALQVALLVPILAGLVGLFNSFHMMRLPDPTPSGSVEGMAFG